MATWADLAAELDRWAAARLCARFWWRDDDAVSDSPALTALLECAAGVPVALATIPALADDSLSDRLSGEPQITVFQHGWRHHDHAAVPPCSEYPAGRNIATVLDEFREGRRLLLERFGERALPVFTPPWHGLADAYFPLLCEAGLSGLSRRGPRAAPKVGGLIQVNVHCVPIEWTSPPRCGDEATYLGQICRHLEGRRTGAYDRDEPTGVLTHHLVQDQASYTFLSRLSAEIAAHSAAAWVDPRDLFHLG